MRQAPLRPSWSGLELMKCLGRDHVRGRPYTYDSITVTSRRACQHFNRRSINNEITDCFNPVFNLIS